jgi:adenine-specific DNA-methyltransferase
MSTKKNKLELTWIGKDQRPRLEPRILLEDPTLSHHAPHKVTENDLFDNRLIFGDNLLALKALEQEFAGKVKCVFIDPPYNTGSAFTHYDDGLEHSIWLGLMRDRLELIKRLLSDDGSLWVTLDDNEAHYFKVMADEVFGRSNYICDFIWQKKKGGGNDSKFVAVEHEYIIVYAKDKAKQPRWFVSYSEEYGGRYKEVDDEGRYYWDTFKRKSGKQYYPITCPDGTILEFDQNNEKISWLRSEKTFLQNLEDKEARIIKIKDTWSVQFKQYMPEGKKPRSILSDIAKNSDGSDEMLHLFGSAKAFDYPKPEKLISYILDMATNPDDLVLDSFAGSGTTGAVAHKMGRRWIMVELGEHCHTHIIPRLQKVVDGTDQGGISKAVNWQGGGGFRYYKLAGSLLEKDHWGNWVISKQYNPAMLTEALCKLEGFTYAPNDTLYWQQGYSTESDYIYVTTQTLSAEQLQALSDEVGTERSLLVLCSAFKGNAERFSNLTVKKIPRAVLAKCEWGHDDYSLNVENLPMAEKPPENVVTRSARQSPKSPEQLSLLAEESVDSDLRRNDVKARNDDQTGGKV